MCRGLRARVGKTSPYGTASLLFALMGDFDFLLSSAVTALTACWGTLCHPRRGGFAMRSFGAPTAGQGQVRALQLLFQEEEVGWGQVRWAPDFGHPSIHHPSNPQVAELNIPAVSPSV